MMVCVIVDDDDDVCIHPHSHTLTHAPSPSQAFVEAGGVSLLVDLVALSHEAAERTALVSPLGNNLLAASAAAAEPSEWFWYETGKGEGKEGGREGGTSGDVQQQREEAADADKGVC